MMIASIWQRLHTSFVASAGTIVFGMVDGTVSIFGLIFGVAATTTDSKAVLIAGASGAVAAAVSMMAGAYLDVETTRDESEARRARSRSEMSLDAGSLAASLTSQLTHAGLTAEQSAALSGAVQNNRPATAGLLLALQAAPDAPLNPWEQAIWMLFADFFASAVPILPFVLLPIPHARIVSGSMTITLLIGLGIGRARITKRDMLRTITETVGIGVAGAIAGVLIGLLINHWFTGAA
jgi:VIT1/CCC1 family predicted Fe2+/Mn2+ transporter